MTIGILLAFFIIAASMFITIYSLPEILPAASAEAETGPGAVIQGINIFFLSLFSFSSALIFRISFSKTLAPELFFFTIFVLSFSLETFRLVFLFLESRSAPFIFGIITTRIVYFGRFLRVYSIFVAGLFACSIANPKTGIYLGIGILLSIAFAVGIPVNATEKTGAFLYVVGIERFVRITFGVGEFLSIINFIFAGILKNTREYFFMGAAFFITLAGSTLLITFPDRLLFLIAGIPLIISGTVIFGKRSHELYLWS